MLNCSLVKKKRRRRRKCFRYGVTRRKQSALVKPIEKPLYPEIEQSSFHRPNFIRTVILGNYEMETWFWSPYPDEYVSYGTVYVCEKCLGSRKSLETLKSHIVRCKAEYPPGDEIFRQDNISVFEVDGEKSKIYCQHLCMLGKLFIDHKALFYDVEPFLFYVATLWSASGLHLIGYFSKQKQSEERHNLSCIVTFPCYQKRGFGRFLIDFSFLLSRREKVLGSAEKPLSDLGLLAYRSYWRAAILEFLYLKMEHDGSFCHLSVDDIARATGIEHADVLETLNELEMLSVEDESLFLDINFTTVRSHWEKARKDPRRVWIDERNLKVLCRMSSRKSTRTDVNELCVGLLRCVECVSLMLLLILDSVGKSCGGIFTGAVFMIP
uniref:histone acetyltransferase n=1 Tax=Syphacia muris TaxID=451379 RepID=A0A0N5AXI5_9BILA